MTQDPEPRQPAPVDLIEGQIRRTDGTNTNFMIDPDAGYTQWGASTEALGDNVELLSAMTRAVYEHLEEAS